MTQDFFYKSDVVCTNIRHGLKGSAFPYVAEFTMNAEPFARVVSLPVESEDAFEVGKRYIIGVAKDFDRAYD